MANQKLSPKFEVGQSVNLKKKTLYGETTGIITKVEKVFTEVNRFTNRIDPNI